MKNDSINLYDIFDILIIKTHKKLTVHH